MKVKILSVEEIVARGTPRGWGDFPIFHLIIISFVLCIGLSISSIIGRSADIAGIVLCILILLNIITLAAMIWKARIYSRNFYESMTHYKVPLESWNKSYGLPVEERFVLCLACLYKHECNGSCFLCRNSPHNSLAAL